MLFKSENYFTMKAIFLFSSIFYLLGLKIGHKIDLFKNTDRIEKISVTKDHVKPVSKPVHYSKEIALKKDSLHNSNNTCVIEKSIVEDSHL